MRDTALPKKPRRSLPNGETWNQASWKQARKRAIASKEPFCAICHKYIDVELPKKDPITGVWNKLAVEVDHIVPTSRGGQLYAIENLQLSHSDCNRKKGAKMTSDYEANKFVNPFPLSHPW